MKFFYKNFYLKKNRVDHDDVLNQTNTWLSNFSHQVESQDASIIEQVDSERVY